MVIRPKRLNVCARQTRVGLESSYRASTFFSPAVVRNAGWRQSRTLLAQLSGVFEHQNVCDVLGPSNGPLVLDQVIKAQKGDGQAIEQHLQRSAEHIFGI